MYKGKHLLTYICNSTRPVCPHIDAVSAAMMDKTPKGSGITFPYLPYLFEYTSRNTTSAMSYLGMNPSKSYQPADATWFGPGTDSGIPSKTARLSGYHWSCSTGEYNGRIR